MPSIFSFPTAFHVYIQNLVDIYKSDIIGSNVRSYELFSVFCTVDQNKASSFNDRQYPIQLRNFWTVMLQYIPRHAHHGEQLRSTEEILKSQTEHYAILVRKSSEGENNRDVKVTLSSPETEFKPVDITLTPKDDSESRAKVMVNGQGIQINDNHVYNLHKDYIKIYTLPNGEVKVEVLRHFNVLFDGKRVRIEAKHSKLKNQIIGLCGPLNGEPSEEFLTTQNCYAHDASKFVRSFEVEGEEGQRIRNQFAGNPDMCAPKVSPRYANLISNQDAQRYDTTGPFTGGCSSIQTRYIEEDGRICFTTKPVLSCDKKCQPVGVSLENVPVHCIAKSNVAQLWTDQIDQGVRRDFSLKKPTKIVAMQLPESCISANHNFEL